MRFAKLISVLILCFTAALAFGQIQPEEGSSLSKRDLSHSVHIFPNPAVEFVHVKILEVPSSKVILAVYNILGNKMEVETEVVDEHELRVRVKDLSSGYYLLAIKEEEAKFSGTFKFLKR